MQRRQFLLGGATACVASAACAQVWGSFQTPGAAGIGLKSGLSNAVAGGSPPYVPTTPTGIKAAGNSLVANSGGISVSGSSPSQTWVMTRSTANGYAGWFIQSARNAWLTRPGWSFGVGSTTSLNLLDRMNSNSTATTGNPAAALTGNAAADNNMNIKSDGVYSPLSDPGNVVFLQATHNDFSWTAYYTSASVVARTMETILDQFISGGATRLYVQSETPEGRYYAQLVKSGTSGAVLSGNTLTLTKTGLQNVVMGDDFGVCGLFGADASGILTRYTKVSSAPSAGQYSVATGTNTATVTFGGTAPTTAWATFDYMTTAAGTTGQARWDVYLWMLSSAAAFIPQVAQGGSGVPFTRADGSAMPGMLYNRPQVAVIDAAQVQLQGGTTGATACNAPGTHGGQDGWTSPDTIHPSHAGGHMLLPAYRVQFLADYPSLPILDQLPTVNNFRLVTGNGVRTTFGSASGDTVFSASLIAALNASRLLQFRVYGTSINNTYSVDPASGVISGTGLTSGSYNWTTGAWTMTFSSATFAPVNARIAAEGDATNLILNGLLDTTMGTPGALPSGVTGTGVPQEWTMALDAGTAAAVAAGNMTVTTSVAADGRYQVAIQGNSGTGTAITFSAAAYGALLRLGANDNVRSGYVSTIKAGPDGRLYGVFGVPVSHTLLSSATFTRNGSTSFSAQNGKAVTGASTRPMDDRDLTYGEVAGDFTMRHLTDTSSLTGMTLTSSSVLLTLGYVAGPVSATWLLGNVAQRNGWPY